MQNVKDALLRMVKAAMKAKELREHYVKMGIDDDPPFQIYGDILDGIYSLVGEHTETFEESVTNIIMNAPALTENRRAKILYGEYVKNFECYQPAPNTISREEMRKIYAENGGYMTPEGDWQ